MTTDLLLPDVPVPDLSAYEQAGGGRGLQHALDLGPEAVVEEVRAAGLRGRGGAGFPTGTKWGSVVSAAADTGSPAYLVCNAAEGEPGTYKDRTLIARNPFQLIEGLCIALHATGAEAAYIGIKRRFDHELARLIDARDAMAAAGYAAAERIRVVPGPDEYLFGEESAMVEVIEGKLPLPRIMPPYMAGLFATMASPNPTVVNNVETLSHVTWILADGVEAFRAQGTEESPGTMVFTVLGDVPNAGVYELPLGTPLRTLVSDIGGARDVLAVYGGTSNSVITPDVLDLPMDFDSLAEAGTGLGSGGFIVYDTSRDIVQVCATLARFLAIESCGQCLPCKLGTTDMWERLDRIVAGDGTRADLDEIRKRTTTVTDQNRCYLPVGAALVIRSTLDTFPEQFEAHLGRAADPAVAVDVPKISSVDHDTGAVVLDPDYDRKLPDWSYAPAPR